VRCRFRDAGHILGSAILEVWVSEAGHTRKLVFSGDLGQPGRPIVRDPTPIDSADVLVVESTYGNRLHRPLGETIDELVFVIEDTLRRRQGNIIIPAFALGRTQELLHLLLDLCRQGKLPRMQVFVDSPMANKRDRDHLRSTKSSSTTRAARCCRFARHTRNGWICDSRAASRSRWR
jgi:metallo-beta-lactamase family protein